MNKFYLPVIAAIAAAIFTSSSAQVNTENKKFLGSDYMDKLSETSFRVESVSPQGDLPANVSFPSVQVQFSEAVVPLAKLGEPSDTNFAVSIIPPIKGTFRWYGTSLLSFDSAEELIPQKEYTIQINPRLTSQKGTLISGPLTYTFRTEEMRITHIQPGFGKKGYVNSDDILPEYARTIAVNFANRVNVSVVKEYLSVTETDSGLEYPFKAEQNGEKSVILRIKGNFPKDTDFTVTLKKGAVPDKNCIETSAEQSFKFHTLRPIRLENADGTSSIRISFNHRLQAGREAEILSAFTFSPKMDVLPSQVKIQGNTVLIEDLPVTYGDAYSFRLAKNTVSDIYGQVYDKEIERKVTVPDADSYASYKDGNFIILESAFEPKRAFEFQNILEGSSYTLTPLAPGGKSGEKRTYELFPSAETKNRRVIQTVELAPCLTKTEQGYTGAVKLESTVFVQPYYSSRKEGEKRSFSSFIQVTDLSMNVHSAWNEVCVMLTSMQKNTAVEEATVSVYMFEPSNKENRYERMLLGEGKKIASKKTSTEGLAVLSFSAQNPRAVLYIEACTKDDRAVMPLNFAAGGFYEVRSLDGDVVVADEDFTEPYISGGTSRAVTYVFSDRGLYKPGETVSVKIIDRTLTRGTYSTYNGPYEISFVNNTWRQDRTVFTSVEGRTSQEGGASTEWKIPEDIAPGTYFVQYKRTDGSNFATTQNIQVQFFERLRFQASSELSPIIYLKGDTVSATVKASYLGGGALVGGSVHADWSRAATAFTPAGEDFEGFSFGPLLYDWYWKQNINRYDSFYDFADERIAQDGTAHVSVATGSEPIEGAAYNYMLEAQVTDAGNQMIATRTSAIVHPAAFYIGLSGIQNVRGFAKKGEKLSFEYILATPEGSTAVDALLASDKKITWTLTRKEWEEVPVYDEYGYEQTEWKEKIITEQKGSLSLEQKTEGTLTLSTENGGRYLLTLSAEDASGRKVITEHSFFVTGSSLYTRHSSVDGYEVELTPDKAEYEAGETAHVLLQNPLEKGRYLVTLEREGVLSEKVLELTESTTVIDVPIKDEYVPVVWLEVSTFIPRTGEPEPKYDAENSYKPMVIYAGTSLNISRASKQFDIDVSFDKPSYQPGEKARVTLSAKKQKKALSGAELTLMVVDRGVLDLIGYNVEDAAGFFYNEGNFTSGTRKSSSVSYVVDPVTYGTYTMSAREREIVMNTMMMKSYATAAGAAPEAAMLMRNDVMDMADMVEESAELEEDGGSDVPRVRKDFRATAVFLPALVTNEDGTTFAEFTLPDSLTEYVVTVIGVREQNFGYSKTQLTVANPISVRDVETRILRPGDEGEAGVVITNIGAVDETVEVTFDVLSGLDKTDYKPAAGEILRLPGKASVLGSSKKKITVKAGATETLMFRVNAESDGWVTLSFAAKSANLNEIIYKPLEIEKPYIYETVTTVGEVSNSESEAEERIIFPSGTEDGRGSLYVQLDATRLGTLGSAVRYVFHYPYGCLEQRSSAILPLIAFGEYIQVFGLESQVDNPFAVVQAELSEWAKVQKKDGGFPYWSDGEKSSYAVSLRIGEILSIATERGIEIPSALNVKRLANYLKSETERLKKENALPLYAASYAMYVLTRLGENVTDNDIEAIILSKEVGTSELCFAGLSALEKGNTALAQKAATRLKNYIALTVRGASFQTATPWYGWYFFNGQGERYALALHFLTKLNVEDVYNTHLVWQLLEEQKSSRGYWHSTADTARVLIALEAYIKANKLDDTDFSAEALLNGKSVLTGRFNGAGAKSVDKTYRFAGLKNPNVKQGDVHYSSEWEELDGDIPFDKEVPLVFSKNGTGHLFYTASMTYALPADEQKARDEGLCVYVEITDARTGKRVLPGNLKSGTIYKEKVYVTTTKQRTFVAVRAPVPAGCEILNPAFTTTATVPQASSAKEKTTWWQYRMSHQDIYDAEIRCFWDTMPIGSQSFEFTFRAERTGVYETPATQAECMYEPEIFGRSDGAVWKIEP